MHYAELVGVAARAVDHARAYPLRDDLYPVFKLNVCRARRAERERKEPRRYNLHMLTFFVGHRRMKTEAMSGGVVPRYATPCHLVAAFVSLPEVLVQAQRKDASRSFLWRLKVEPRLND